MLLNPLRSPSTCRVLDCSMPRFAKGRDCMPAVLLIHGFSMGPHIMEYLFDRLAAEGFTVSLPRLPGHGTCGDDFARTGWKDWYGSAMESYLDLKRESDRVYIAGLSMGGLIASLLAQQFDIPRIVLAAPAFKFTPGSPAAKLWITPLFSWLIPSVKKRGGVKSEFGDDRDIQEQEYKGRLWLRQGHELIKLKRFAVKQLDKIRSRSLIIVSEGDYMVSSSTASFLENKMSRAEQINSITLRDSGHNVVGDVDRESVADQIITWFE